MIQYKANRFNDSEVPINYKAELEFYKKHLFCDVLPFWEKYASDDEFGGFSPALAVTAESYYPQINTYGAKAECFFAFHGLRCVRIWMNLVEI